MNEFWVVEGFLRQDAGLGANERRVNVNASTVLEVMNGPSGTPDTSLPLGNGVWSLGGSTGLVRDAIVTFTNPVSRMTLAGRTWVRLAGWRLDSNYNHWIRAVLAQEILDRADGRSTTGRRLDLFASMPGSSEGSGRSARENLRDAAAGLQSQRAAAAGNGEIVGGRVFLEENLLRAILRMNDRFGRIHLNTLTGARHTRADSRHYQGRAADFHSVGGIIGGTGVRPNVVLSYLEGTHGFFTQRTTTGNPDRNYVGADNVFHLEIWPF